VVYKRSFGLSIFAEKTAKAFRSRGVKQISISNRSFERAEALATITGGRPIHFEHWAKEIGEIDILVSSTAAPHAIITYDKLPFLPARRNRPLLMIDLAMPRDIDPVFHHLDGVYLYDLDSLHAMAERTLSLRQRESEKCRQLIEHQVQDFQRWIEQTHSSTFPSLVVALPGP